MRRWPSSMCVRTDWIHSSWYDRNWTVVSGVSTGGVGRGGGRVAAALIFFAFEGFEAKLLLDRGQRKGRSGAGRTQKIAVEPVTRRVVEEARAPRMDCSLGEVPVELVELLIIGLIKKGSKRKR